jgi:IS605 OrfB family transposase
MSDLNRFPIIGLGSTNESPYIETLNGKENLILRCTIIEIKPTFEQRKIIEGWYPWARYAYNRAIREVNKLLFKGESVPGLSKLRKLVNSNIPKHIKNTRIASGIPAQTFDHGIIDVIKAYKTAFALKKKGIIKHFRIRYKKTTAPKETLVLERAFSIKHNSFVMGQMGNHINTTGGEIKGINKACRLQWNKRTGKIILYVPKDKYIKEVDCRSYYCALDPGIRTFQTLYSPDSKAEYGTKEPLKIGVLIKKINKYKKFEGTKWYKKYSRRLYKRIQGIRDELHWKTALTLVRSYDKILIGNMSTRSIVSKRSNLNKTTKTVAYMLSHYLFRTRLEAKAEEYGSQVIIVDEKWTSKTCGGCSKVDYDLGAKKIFRCPQSDCNFKLDRDLNGARNIALNYFKKFNPIFGNELDE